MQSTTPDKIRNLDPAEMLKLGLITALSATDMLADPLSCMTTMNTPENCVRREPSAPLMSLEPQSPEPS
jgi:hypothetical protein